MKRMFCLILTIIVVVSCAACSSKRMSGISDRAYEYGLAALETADDFIDGKIDAETATQNLDRVGILVDGCDGENDALVSSRISLVKLYIARKGNGTGTMDQVEEHRDSLAELLGE